MKNQSNVSGEPLSEETLKSLEELGEILRCIHKRMEAEGYIIVDGKVVKKDQEPHS